MDTPGKRLKAVTKYYGLSQYALAQRIGVSKGYISQIINNGSPISANIIDGLIKSFAGLNIHWLMTGEGKMLIERKEGESDILGVVNEPAAPPYNRRPGEGRLEWLERSLTDALEGRLKTQEELRDALEKMNTLLREQKALLERVEALEDEVRKGKE